MSFCDDLEAQVADTFKKSWETKEGIVVPDTNKVTLGNNAVLCKGTVLYADLADSTSLVKSRSHSFAAEVYKTYLVCACKIIEKNGGVITAFDGDRVMAVYMGNSKNTSAANSALQINYAVTNIINPKLKETYADINYVVRHAVGVDTGELFVAKTGIRGSNDLVWVDRSANYAAKMCSLRNGYYVSYLTKDVFDQLNESVKYGGSPKQLMWEECTWTEMNIKLYRSSWWVKP